MSTGQDVENNSKISTGAGILVIALFGFARKLGWETQLDWWDGIVSAIGVASIVSGLVTSKPSVVAISVAAMVGALGYRHGLFKVDMGLLLFGLLLVVGGSMVINGLSNKS